MTILPSSRAWLTRSVEMFRIRALVWKLSVTMPIWAPVKLMAGTPWAWIAIAIRATLTCSPVARSMSISRAGGRSWISLACLISSSVVCPCAETTTRTFSPRLCAAMARRAAARIFDESATLVPPNFCTRRAKVFAPNPKQATDQHGRDTDQRGGSRGQTSRKVSISSWPWGRVGPLACSAAASL